MQSFISKQTDLPFGQIWVDKLRKWMQKESFVYQTIANSFDVEDSTKFCK